MDPYHTLLHPSTHHTRLTHATNTTFPTFIIVDTTSTPSRLYLPSAKGILLRGTYNILYNYIFLSFGCSLVQITDMNRHATVTYQISEPLSARRRRTSYTHNVYDVRVSEVCMMFLSCFNIMNSLLRVLSGSDNWYEQICNCYIPIIGFKEHPMKKNSILQ
jgi:hypothetical protein